MLAAQVPVLNWKDAEKGSPALHEGDSQLTRQPVFFTSCTITRSRVAVTRNAITCLTGIF